MGRPEELVVYRDLVSDEIISMLNNESWAESYSGSGKNTFDYSDGDYYKHFFLYADHADFYKPLMRAAVIGIYAIPENIVAQRGFGFYSHVRTPINNKLWDKEIPFPEIIIRNKDCSNDQMISFKSGFHREDIDMFSEYSNPFEKKFKTTDYNYTKADIYYEVVYKYALRHNFNFENVAKVLATKDLDLELEEFFTINYDYFDEEGKKIKIINRNI